MEKHSENDFENNVVHCLSVDQIISKTAANLGKFGIIFQTDLASFAARSKWTNFCNSIISKYGNRLATLMCGAILHDNVMFFNSEAELADLLKEMRFFDRNTRQTSPFRAGKDSAGAAGVLVLK